MAGEVIAGAMPIVVFESEIMGVVVTPEAKAEVGKGDSLRLQSIVFRFFDLAD